MRISILFFLVLFISVPGRAAKKVQIPKCKSLLSGRGLDSVTLKLHGGNPLEPTEDSLLGQYIKQAKVETRVHRFRTYAGSKKGPKKLVVEVTPESFDLFYKLFGKKNANLLEHLHTPNQGTLLVRWRTHTFGYGVMKSEWRFPHVGTIGPMILLSDSEVLRLYKYWELNKSGDAICRMPWQVQGYDYPVDAYGGNCTAWFGHIPVGDKTFSKVISPGSLDRYGDNSGKSPRKGKLNRYRLTQGKLDRKLFHEVWKVNLHERLFDLLGVPLQVANHTNPGWVAVSLTALVDSDRVPFVAYYSDPNTKGIPKKFTPQINPL